ncbi:hypothetical protein Tco_0822780 [Tanacetum coccineum]|uniref:Reverse transcriptase domain-containing protein n=1 Tax=Tanacetum coccineum TaxID=301880 RepID=A0ABQ5AG17_9ASTR
MDGLTLDGSFIPHSLVYQEKEQEPKTITEVVEIPSSQSTPLVPPPETPPLSAPKTKENLDPNPHPPLIPYLSRFKEEIFQALENPTGRADHFVYKIEMSVSHHEEFADELAHIISPPEYDYFYFDLETNPGEFTSVVEKNIFDLSSTKDSTSIELNDSSLLLSDCDSSLSKEFFEIDLLVSFPSGNEDIVFDPGIFIIKGVQSQSFHILPLDDFSTISVISDFLLLTDPSAIETFLSFLSRNEDKVFDPDILLINGIFSFTRKSPHLLIDKCHILSEISLLTESLVSFHPKDKEIRGESS